MMTLVHGNKYWYVLILLFTSSLLLISTFLYLSSPIHRKPINIENPHYALKSKRELSRMAINLFIPKRVRIICVNITLTICHLHLGGKFYCCRKSVKNHLLKRFTLYTSDYHTIAYKTESWCLIHNAIVLLLIKKYIAWTHMQ
jgi:hypothetical protein